MEETFDFTFDADDVNDPILDHIIDILEKYDPEFVGVQYGDGNIVTLQFNDDFYVEDFGYDEEDFDDDYDY